MQENYKILVVDDDMRLRALLERYLTEQGFQVRSVANAEQMDRLLTRESFHLMVLDLMLPGEDGLSICRRLRSQSNPMPIIMVTAKGEEVDRIVGLEIGADDYIPKPFSPQELVLRVCAVLRRCYPAQPDTLQLAACTLDLSNAEAIRPNGERVSLTVKERDILTALARNANRIVTSEALCDAAWGDSFGYGQSLMTHVRRIREKIEADPSHPASLVTAKGLGYKLIVQG